MNPTLALFFGLAVASTMGFTVAWYLKSHLRGILMDLCGNEGRADFWIAFSNVILMLVPIAFGMQFQMDGNIGLPVAFQLNHQLKWIFFGQILSVLSLGAVLALSIRRHESKTIGS